MLGDQRERVVSSGVIGVVLEHQLGHARGEGPVASLPGRTSERFETKERLGPRVRAWQRAPFPRRVLHRLAALLALRRSQAEFSLQRLERNDGERLTVWCRLERAQRGIRR